ncbi:hypothetical protein Pa4123_81100 [Phytohabitans aurantiacus]|uniref:Uncharacterized protein n=1 Tax=Phytohabitans aurantiacus TaxID=3016789 RepID=A0ABQ5RA99_9ACTN|nr:hypothetical protein Pa4123_81100 [Phytohabitans aurantiacus]
MWLPRRMGLVHANAWPNWPSPRSGRSLRGTQPAPNRGGERAHAPVGAGSSPANQPAPGPANHGTQLTGWVAVGHPTDPTELTQPGWVETWLAVGRVLAGPARRGVRRACRRPTGPE